MKKIRNANIELLRILAMYMIVIYHITWHCVNTQLTDPASFGKQTVDFFNHLQVYKRLLLLNTVTIWGPVGNAIFILISGYFLACKEPEAIKLGEIAKKLLLQMGFAALLLVGVPPLLHWARPEIFVYLQKASIFNGMAWFVGYYFLVVLFGRLFLNGFLSRLNEQKYCEVLFTLLACTQFSYIIKLANGLSSGLDTVLAGLFFYVLGGFIRRFDPFKKVRMYVFFLITGLVYLLLLLSAYNAAVTKIEQYVRSGSTKPFTQALSLYANNDILVIVLAVCLFEVFRRFHLPQNRCITFLGGATFMVYLLHDNAFFYELWNLRDWITTLWESPVLFAIQECKWAAYTFAAGVCAYILYIVVMAVLKRCKRLILK